MGRKYEFYLTEYSKLKEEQLKRINFRDNLIYLTLAAIGAIFSFSVQQPSFTIAYLILPFLCIVLGWTYLRNDKKISQISVYINTHLINSLNDLIPQNEPKIENTWDQFRTKYNNRNKSQKFQMLIDLSMFSFSGCISIIAFLVISPSICYFHIILIGVEMSAIIFLSSQLVLNHRSSF